MEDKLSIVALPQQTHLLLEVSGRVDGFWSKLLDERIESTLREGYHQVALDLSKVSYMSSLGIRVLVKHAKTFRQINGVFGIAAASEVVNSLLKMAGLDVMLAWQQVRQIDVDKTKSLLVEANGFSFEFNAIESDRAMQCTLYGHPEKMKGEGFTVADNKLITFGHQRFGLGLGATGMGFEDCRDRYGEFIGLGNALVYTPAGDSSAPDYMLKTGELIPSVNMLYGIVFEGGFEELIHFQPSETGASIGFGRLLTTVFEQTGYEKLAMVAIGEIQGLVGISLRMSPVHLSHNRQTIFKFPEIRDNVHFTTEPVHQGMIAVVAGIAVRSKSNEFNAFLRPASPGSPFLQHFHAAVFSYHPIKKTNIDLQESIETLFEEDKILSVMHLINDSREFTGAGETEFKNGVTWVSEIQSLKKS
jgi:anti-sigma B factor antagonist